MDDEKPPICYLGHEWCWDQHTAERLADEADWEQEREEDAIREAEKLIGGEPWPGH